LGFRVINGPITMFKSAFKTYNAITDKTPDYKLVYYDSSVDCWHYGENHRLNINTAYILRDVHIPSDIECSLLEIRTNEQSPIKISPKLTDKIGFVNELDIDDCSTIDEMPFFSTLRKLSIAKGTFDSNVFPCVNELTIYQSAELVGNLDNIYILNVDNDPEIFFPSVRELTCSNIKNIDNYPDLQKLTLFVKSKESFDVLSRLHNDVEVTIVLSDREEYDVTDIVKKHGIHNVVMLYGDYKGVKYSEHPETYFHVNKFFLTEELDSHNRNIERKRKPLSMF